MQDEGQPEAYIAGAAGGTKSRGDSTLRETGNAERCEIRGDSKIHRRHSQMDRRCEATRRFVAGAAEGTRRGGDPEARCWSSRKMQELSAQLPYLLPPAQQRRDGEQHDGLLLAPSSLARHHAVEHRSDQRRQLQVLTHLDADQVEGVEEDAFGVGIAKS